ncbi:DNA replication and repair protein RecF [Acaryochloris thomasi RCC1774]|uniref:DNA replication and repair protein RecF n=1 Tax=Acaryochloris thomasi RCC1774 TaxID=1764569 RepID=A0A2W1JH85_9CYAN|nr:TIR domain-containing protein [Acaryochloris thomasi]PZD72726.1 DNA replication and repair protein RecF [Acaryochloris thomasi RCC1774]
MRIESLSVKNFKGFEERSFEFPHSFTLVVGENASGKTSILEATTVALQNMFTKLQGVNALSDSEFGISEEQVQIRKEVYGNSIRFEPQHPSWVDATFSHLGEKLQSYSSFNTTSKNEFDVYFSYNHSDKKIVHAIAEDLRNKGVSVWLDDWEILPGRPWKQAIKGAIKTTRSVAVCIGERSILGWQGEELQLFIDEFSSRNIPIIPILLPSASAKEIDLPLFLRNFAWVDMRKEGYTTDILRRIHLGIVGELDLREKLPLADYQTQNGEVIPLADIFERISQFPRIPMPVIAFYNSNRLPPNQKTTLSVNRSKTDLSRRYGYQDCLKGKLAIPDIFSWLRDEQFSGLQENTESLLFQTVTYAMCSCIPGATSIEYSIRQYDLVVEFDNGDIKPYGSLSDGQRIMLSLVADIAYRAAWMNPHLEDKVLQETDGVILIDELDLHLHPKWQRRVVDDLKRTFPKIQFIVTSHSPFIIQSLEPGELIVLDDEPQIEYANRGVEEIARFIQGVDQPYTSQRYVDQKAASKRYFSLLREGRSEDDPELLEAKRKLDELTAHYPDNPASDAFLEIQRLAAQGNNHNE